MTMKDVAIVSKKTGEELQQYLHFRKRGFSTRSKKGKGSYSRKQKHNKPTFKGEFEND